MVPGAQSAEAHPHREARAEIRVEIQAAPLLRTHNSSTEVEPGPQSGWFAKSSRLRFDQLRSPGLCQTSRKIHSAAASPNNDLRSFFGGVTVPGCAPENFF